MLRKIGITAVASLAFVAAPLGVEASASAAPASDTAVTPYQTSVGMAATADGKGYWITDIHGGVFSFGDANFYGSLPGQGVSVSDIVGIAATPEGRGYWLYGADGGVFSFGDAAFYGSVPGLIGRAAPDAITDMVPTEDGRGYWMVGADGGVFTFGDAQFHGSLPGSGIVTDPARVADSVAESAYVTSSDVFLQPTPDGGGYWIADSSGDVFSFGDAHFYGSLPGALGSASIKTSSVKTGSVEASNVAVGHPASVPITGFVATPDGGGYWMVGTDGSVYDFGDAAYHGSLPSIGINVPSVTVTGYTRPDAVDVNIPRSTVGNLVRTPDGGGYWIASLDGGVFSFGDAGFYGSIPGINLVLGSITP